MKAADDAAARGRAISALMETAFLMERALADPRRTGAYRRAQTVIAELSTEEFGRRLRDNTFTELPGIGSSTNDVVRVAAGGGVPERLAEARALAAPDTDDGWELVAELRGDLHAHSDWSDGGSPIPDMAETARALGHEYLALTDHSPRLTVANGLTARTAGTAAGRRRRAEPALAPTSGCSPASRWTSSTTARWTRTPTCWRSSTSSSPPCTPSCGCRPAR